jgi:spermidine synthase
MSVPESADQEWNEWYNGEYIPGYRKVPGVIYARRYRVVEGESGYTTVYEFESETVSETDEWNKQRQGSSPRSDRMREVMTHLQGSPGVYRRIYPQ